MADISRTDLLAFMRQQQYAVQASVSASGTPQAAVVGIVVSDRVEVFSTRWPAAARPSTCGTTPPSHWPSARMRTERSAPCSWKGLPTNRVVLT